MGTRGRSGYSFLKYCGDLDSLTGDLWLDTTSGDWDDIFEQQVCLLVVVLADVS